jgi:predicted metal-dependent hydrolase
MILKENNYSVMKSKKVIIPGIGDVLICKSSRAKHMRLSVRPFRGVRVAVPTGVSFKSAEDFVRTKSGWILTHLPKMKAMEQAANQFQRTAGPNLSPSDKKKAKAKLVDRLNALSLKNHLPFNRVFIRNQKTRWGSCSAKKNINLNINLARLTDELMDYAIMHELVHTRQMNHSRLFWDALEELVPNARYLDQKLQEHSFMLMRPEQPIP